MAWRHIRGRSPGEKRGTSNWGHHVTRAQVRAITEIRRECNQASDGSHSYGDDWTVFMFPSTGQARYVELRHRLLSGRLARWVVDSEGEVEAHNFKGESTVLHRHDGTILEAPMVPPRGVDPGIQAHRPSQGRNRADTRK
jgi:hypothetical protein